MSKDATTGNKFTSIQSQNYQSVSTSNSLTPVSLNFCNTQTGTNIIQADMSNNFPVLSGHRVPLSTLPGRMGTCDGRPMDQIVFRDVDVFLQALQDASMQTLCIGRENHDLPEWLTPVFLCAHLQSIAKVLLSKKRLQDIRQRAARQRSLMSPKKTNVAKED